MNIHLFKKDLTSGIVVFIVALPLCLGVALASGAPLMSGIISGIIGGIVVGLISQSNTSVSGPAAGLAAVVLSAINELNGFETFLTAVFLAGVFQCILSILKAGMIAEFIPSNVIKGLLAAIGIILILKQIPHAIGFDKDPEDDFSFFQQDNENSFTEILKALEFITPGAVVISIVSIFILLKWHKLPLGKLNFLPGSLVVVLIGILLNILFNQFIPFLSIEETHLVNIPSFHENSLQSFIHLPDFEVMQNFNVWKIAITIAAVASLETLLNIEAIDKIDPKKRTSPPTRELMAQGIGNIFAGILGGIPVTSVIVRSSVNIQSENETKLSAIIHGFLIFISFFAFSTFINLIPLASLAAILIITGYKLTGIKLFKEMYQKGWGQFIPFFVTIIAIVFTDLLVGVLVGLCISILNLLVRNYKNPFVKENNVLLIGEVTKISLPNQVSFFNKAIIKQTLLSVNNNSRIIIDASKTNFIDHDILEIIENFKKYTAPKKQIQLNIFSSKNLVYLNEQVQFVNVLDKTIQDKLTPAEVLNILKKGNQRFVKGEWADKDLLHQISATSLGQNPMAIIIGCIDSRTSPELLFDAGLGDLCIIRIAGNIVSPEIIGSIELAVKKLGVKLIVIKGHSKCGAVATAFAPSHEVNETFVAVKIQKAIHDCHFDHKSLEEINESQMMEITKRNTENSLQDIIKNSDFLLQKIKSQEIGIVSSYHDVTTGEVLFSKMFEI